MAGNDTRAMADERFVELLREMGEDDPGVTLCEFCRALPCSPSTVYARFGGWPELRARAGLSPHGRRGRPTLYTADDVREAFRRAVAEVGPSLTKRRFIHLTGISEAAFTRLFGTWTELRAAEGLPPNHRGSVGTTAEDVRAAFRRISAVEGPGLTLERFVALSGYGEATIRRHFANWTGLRESDGPAEPRRRPPVISDERLLAEYARVEKVLGRRPTFRELDHLSFHAGETFRKRFELLRWRRRIRAVIDRRMESRREEQGMDTSSG